MIQVGSCEKCGAPIYSPSDWNGVIPPPASFTCNCGVSATGSPRFIMTQDQARTLLEKGGYAVISEERLAALEAVAEIVRHHACCEGVGDYVQQSNEMKVALFRLDAARKGEGHADP